MTAVMEDLFATILDRQQNPPPGSYTAQLFASGEQEILKKVGEEAVEVILAASAQTDERLVSEVADLFYHALVLLAARGLTLREVEAELKPPAPAFSITPPSPAGQPKAAATANAPRPPPCASCKTTAQTRSADCSPITSPTPATSSIRRRCARFRYTRWGRRSTRNCTARRRRLSPSRCWPRSTALFSRRSRAA
ncbi:MAG: phosphoribosyl-ATP diphosphatase [Chloroflexi bacterium]|nr:phosphoribosyl-ATP diphosphatase [Chloroflexota bacterium]